MAKSPLFNRPAGGGTIFSVAGTNMTTGDIWFVDSGHAAASDATTHGSSPDIPFATLDFAIGQATAAKGDVIYAMPSHAETATTDVELFDLDKSAVFVIGLGDGDLRPTFTISHVDASCQMGAAGCRLSNIRIISGIADVVVGLQIEAAGIGSELDNCYFGGSSGKEFLKTIAVTADADRLLIHDNHIVGLTGEEAIGAIFFAGGSDGTIVRDNIIHGDYKTNAAVDASTAASANMVILNNFIVNIEENSGLCIKFNGSGTGIVAGNFVAGGKNNTQTISTVTLMHCSQNFGNDAVNTYGILTPAAGA